MGTLQVQAELTDTTFPLNFTAEGGTIGLTVVVAIRDPQTDSPPAYLDFNDDTFKTAGHTTRQATLGVVSAADSPGRYHLVGGLDINAWSGLSAAANHVEVEYAVTAGLLNGQVANDVILLRTNAYDLVTAIFGRTMETGFTFDRMMRIIAAAVAGESSGGPTSQVFRNLANTLNQITMAANSSGDRSGSTYGA